MADHDHPPRAPSSKLAPPRRLAPTFIRPRLLHYLDEPAPITLICAPAGTGKTALLASWQVANRIWVRLDEGDQDPMRLVGLLVAAVECAAPECSRAAHDALQEGASPLAVLAILLAALDVDSTERTLILDDCHVLDGASGAEAILESLVRTCPPCLRIVLASRTIPLVPALAATASGALRVLGRADLAILPHEAAGLLEAHGITVEAPEDLVRACDGWAMGIVLLARAQAEHLLFVHQPQEAIARYLMAQIIDRLPAVTRQFVQESALLGSFSAADADAILGRHDSQRQIETLLQIGMFIEPVDAPGSQITYRYHDIFAAALTTRITQDLPERAAAIHRATAEARSADAAVALSHIAAIGDPALLAAWLERLLPTLRTQYLWDTLLRFGERVPMALRSLMVLRVMSHAHHVRGDDTQAIALANQTWIKAEESGDEIAQFSAIVLRTNPLARQDRLEEALSLCLPALERATGAGLTGPMNWLQHLSAQVLLAAGRLAEAKTIYDALFTRLREAANQQPGSAAAQRALVGALHDLAAGLSPCGEDHAAERALDEGARRARDAGDRTLLTRLTATRCEILLLRGNYSAARDLCATVLADLGIRGDLVALHNALCAQAQAQFALKEYQLALETLEEHEMRLGGANIHNWLSHGLALRGRVLLAVGDREAARRAFNRARDLSPTGRVLATLQTEEGLLALADGQLRHAARLFQDAATLFASRGLLPDQARALLLAAAAAIRLEGQARAVRLIGQAAALLDIDGDPPTGWLSALVHEAEPALPDLQQIASHWRLQGKGRRLIDYLLGARQRPILRVVPPPAPNTDILPSIAPTLYFSPFGAGTITLNGTTRSLRELRGEKARELLAYAILQARPLDRARILEALWDDDEDEHTLDALHTASYQIRRFLGPSIWKRAHDVYSLDISVHDDYRSLLAIAVEADDPTVPPETRLGLASRGLNLCSGGSYLPWCSSIWAESPRVMTRTAVLTLWRAVAAANRALGQSLAALDAAEHGLALDSYDEELRKAQIEILIQLGRPREAIEQYQAHARQLKQDGLGPPSEALRQIVRALR
jgi:LuxR family maltose regulon positive regulatory protein